jgi:uncharacterized protein
MKKIFFGPNGLRAGYRFVFFYVAAWLIVQGAEWLLIHPFGYKFDDNDWIPRDFIVDGAISFGALVLVAWFISRLERRSLADYGLPLRGAFGLQFWDGMLWGFATSAIVIGIIWATGHAEFHGFALSGATLARWALVWLVAFLFVGLPEEFEFRGYGLIALARGMGFWPAALLLSLMFGGAHMFKPKESFLDIFNIVIWGLFWCATFKRTGSLWWAIGYHTMSDYSDMVVFAEPNTGNHGAPLTGRLLNVTLQGPAWLTGGIAGTEASVVALVVLIATWWAFMKRYPGPDKLLVR